MARLRSGDLLEAKLLEAERLEAEIRRLKNMARDKQRAEDDQRQKIVGRVVLARMKFEPDGETERAIRAWLAEALTRPGERVLFPDLPQPAATTPALEPADAAVAC